jgi:asparagine synthase (glutamine-hydrolysing)
MNDSSRVADATTWLVSPERFAGWQREERRGLSVAWSGQRAPVDRVLALLADRGPDAARLASLLAVERGHFAVIVQGPDWIVAAVDKIRSAPVFVARQEHVTMVSPSARHLREAAQLRDADPAGVVEMVMAGYATGANTTVRGLHQVRAGQMLIDRGTGPGVSHYFRYVPRPAPEASEVALLDEYGALVDDVFRQVIARAAGRPIWVPLSGGYDSRLVLCKLHELGYANLTAFTYGPRFNYDAKVARQVARTLGVRWLRLTSRPRVTRRLLDEPERRAYWDFGDGLATIPSMRDWEGLLRLVRSGVMPRDAIVINGQTGDYLSGGHIPAALFDHPSPTFDDLLAAMVGKHHALWTNWDWGATLAFTHRRIRAQLDEIAPDQLPSDGRERLLSYYESWEWEERQSKFVVNGQRMYDFFGLGWELPHWDGAFLDFWSRVPFAMKFRQKLFKRYLARWNYAGLFGNYDPFVWRWPLPMMWVIPLARVVGLLRGRAAKDRLYKQLWYFSHYRNHYGMYGFAHYLATMDHARSPISLQVERWLAENGLAAVEPMRGPSAALLAELA